jgi:23S rRNA (adenine2503-C2)-methyltransferase
MTALPLVFEAPRRAQPPRHLADIDPADRRAAVGELGLPGFRADQLARHYFGRFTADVDAMTDLPAPARDTLRELLPPLVTPVLEQACDDGATRKTLWKGHDGTRAESVLMGYPDRATVCVSSQATGEIVEQVRQAAAAARDGALGTPTRLSNVVFMGMGEPLANYKRVIAAVRRITAPTPDGLGISARGVTVSTVGLVPAIDKLAGEGIPVTLAVSLHTPDDELRDTLVPVNNRWKVAEVLDAARRYAQTTGRRVSIEYALIRDVNDHPWRADLLGKLLRQRVGQSRVHVNLIPLNPTPGSKWDASPRRVQDEFVARVQAAGIACTVRDTRGREIAAACGQLAASEA